METSISPARALLQELRAEAGEQRPGADWAALIGEADRRDVAPLLYVRLRGSGRLALLPAAARRALEELYGFSALRSGMVQRELQAALQRLAEAGADVIVLKGAYLAGAVYGDAALRPMGDLDLLVRERDVPRAVRALSGLGYVLPEGSTSTSRHHLPALTRPGAVPIELHRGLLEWPDIAGLWARAVPARVAGEPAFRLAAADLVLQLCLHVGHHHQWQGADLLPLPLRSLFDISGAIERFQEELDWGQLAATANAAGRGRFAYASLRVAQSFAGARVPDVAFAALDHDAETERMVAVIERFISEPSGGEVPVAYRDWRRAADRKTRLKVLLGAVFPPLPQLRAIYGLGPGVRGAALFYLLRPFDLAWRRGVGIFKLATGLAGGRGLAAREHGRDEIHRWTRLRRGRGTVGRPPAGDLP